MTGLKLIIKDRLVLYLHINYSLVDIYYLFSTNSYYSYINLDTLASFMD